VLGQVLSHELSHVLTLLSGLADRQAPDGVAIKRHLGDRACAFAAEVLETRALHNPEERLLGVAARFERSQVEGTQMSSTIMMSLPIAR
jgi:hypothetical protein